MSTENVDDSPDSPDSTDAGAGGGASRASGGEGRIRIRRALVSVSDKTGLADLARALHAAGAEIVSTGSTAMAIAMAGIPVTPVEKVTGFPECLDGRVKTLHPAIHAGILADRRKASHREQLQHLGIAPFDLVVCNLYPFRRTVDSGADFDACVEQIDIGGPAMVRAAAKNHPSVAVVTDPARYGDVARALRAGGFTLGERRALAAAAFAHTAAYDAAISAWFATQLEGGTPGAARPKPAEAGARPLPALAQGTYLRMHSLRYGENPHQPAALYRDAASDARRGIANAVQLHGKAMSYNNYGDADAALRAAYDHAEPCVAIIKHANPCGIAIGRDVAQAHRKAHACDPVSAYGGVIAVNRPVSVQLANQIRPIFTEVVLAPAYEDGALEVLEHKKNLRILRIVPPARGQLEFKQVTGGLLVEKRDDLDAPGDDPAAWQLVAGEPADAQTLADLRFAWVTVRAVRSNAILLVKDGASVGVGMGQVNRVDSCRLAVERANTLGARATGDADAAVGGAQAQAGRAPERARGAVAASDAFFPFADGLQVLIDAGVKAVVQPGGSIRDAQSIEAAKAAGITMYLTHTRHFAH